MRLRAPSRTVRVTGGAALLLVALAGTAVLPAASAQARSACAAGGDGTGFCQTTASPCLRVHAGPGTETFYEGECLKPGTTVHVECQFNNTGDPDANVNGSFVWDAIDDPEGSGALFFVSDYYVNTPVYADYSPGFAHCF